MLSGRFKTQHLQDCVELLLLVAACFLSLQKSLPALPPLSLVVMLASNQPANTKLDLLVLADSAHYISKRCGPGRNG